MMFNESWSPTHEGYWTIFNLTCHLKNTTLSEKRHQSACVHKTVVFFIAGLYASDRRWWRFCHSLLSFEFKITHLESGDNRTEMVLLLTKNNNNEMWFQVVLYLWSVTSWLCIDKIPEVTKTKASKPKRYSLSKLRLVHAPIKQLV